MFDSNKIEKIIKYESTGVIKTFIPGLPFASDLDILEKGQGYIFISKQSELGTGYSLCNNPPPPEEVIPPVVDDSLIEFETEVDEFTLQEEIQFAENVLDNSIAQTADSMIISVEKDTGNKIVVVSKDPDFVPTATDNEKWDVSSTEFIDPVDDRAGSTFGRDIKTNGDLTKVLVAATDNDITDDVVSEDSDSDVFLLSLDTTKDPNEWKIESEYSHSHLVSVDGTKDLDTIVSLGRIDSSASNEGLVFGRALEVDDTVSPTANAIGFGERLQLSGDGSRFATSIDVNSLDNNPSLYVKVLDDNGNFSNIGDRSNYDNFLTNNAFVFAYSKNGTTLAIGDSSDTNNTGVVKLFKFNGQTWTQVGGDINGSGQTVYFGRDVSLSADGNTVAIGAEDYGAIYRWDGGTSTWNQLGNNITSSSPVQSFSVHQDKLSPQLSDDGNRVLFAFDALDGRYLHSIANRESFAVYEWDDSSWELAADVFNKQDDWTFDLGSPGLNKDANAIKIVRFSGDGEKVVFSQPLDKVKVGSEERIRGAVWVLTIDLAPPDLFRESGSYVTQVNKVWELRVNRTIYGQDTGDTTAKNYHTFGEGLAVNSDASIIAVGNPSAKVDGTAASQDGVSPYNTGIVKIYHWYNNQSYESGDWIKGKAKGLLDQPLVRTQRFGYSLSLSSSGDMLAVADPEAETNADTGGYGYVTVLQTSQPTGLLSIKGKDLVENQFQDIEVLGNVSVPLDARPESIAISDDGLLMAVGLPNYFNGAEDGREGAIYIFYRSGVGQSFRLSDIIYGDTYLSGQNTIKGEKLGLRLDWAVIDDKQTLYATGNTSVTLDGSSRHRAINDPYNAKGTLKAFQFNVTPQGFTSWNMLAKQEEFYGISQNASEVNGRSSGNTGFGFSLTTNGVGNYIAVGAPWRDSLATGDDEADSLKRQNAEFGAIYLFELDTTGPEDQFTPISISLGSMIKETITYDDPINGNVDINIGYQVGMTPPTLSCLGDYMSYVENRKSFIKKDEDFDLKIIKEEYHPMEYNFNHVLEPPLLYDGVIFKFQSNDMSQSAYPNGTKFGGPCENDMFDLAPRMTLDTKFGLFDAEVYEGEYNSETEMVTSDHYYETVDGIYGKRTRPLDESCPLLRQLGRGLSAEVTNEDGVIETVIVRDKNVFGFSHNSLNRVLVHQKANLNTLHEFQPECMQGEEILGYSDDRMPMQSRKVAIVYRSQACSSFKIVRRYKLKDFIEWQREIDIPRPGMLYITIAGALIDSFNATVELDVTTQDGERKTIDYAVTDSFDNLNDRTCDMYPFQPICSVTRGCFSYTCGSCYGEWNDWFLGMLDGTKTDADYPECVDNIENESDPYQCKERGDCDCGQVQETSGRNSFDRSFSGLRYRILTNELDDRGQRKSYYECCECGDDPYEAQPEGTVRLTDCDSEAFIQLCQAQDFDVTFGDEFDYNCSMGADGFGPGDGSTPILGLEYRPARVPIGLSTVMTDQSLRYVHSAKIKSASGRGKVLKYNESDPQSYGFASLQSIDVPQENFVAHVVHAPAGDTDAYREELSRGAANKVLLITNISEEVVKFESTFWTYNRISADFEHGADVKSTKTVGLPPNKSVYVKTLNTMEHLTGPDDLWDDDAYMGCEGSHFSESELDLFRKTYTTSNRRPVHAMNGFYWPSGSIKLVGSQSDEYRTYLSRNPSPNPNTYNANWALILPSIEEATLMGEIGHPADINVSEILSATSSTGTSQTTPDSSSSPAVASDTVLGYSEQNQLISGPDNHSGPAPGLAVVIAFDKAVGNQDVPVDPTFRMEVGYAIRAVSSLEGNVNPTTISFVEGCPPEGDADRLIGSFGEISLTEALGLQYFNNFDTNDLSVINNRAARSRSNLLSDTSEEETAPATIPPPVPTTPTPTTSTTPPTGSQTITVTLS